MISPIVSAKIPDIIYPSEQEMDMLLTEAQRNKLLLTNIRTASEIEQERLARKAAGRAARAPVADTDCEMAFIEACDEAGCAYDNEALLKAIADLKRNATPKETRGDEPVAWREALNDIVSWKNDTLGKRPKVHTPLDCAPEITEAFDRGARMAFYRCADRAAKALAAPQQSPRLEREGIAPQVAKLVCCGRGGCLYQGDSEDGDKCYCDTSDFDGSGLEKTVNAILALLSPDSTVVSSTDRGQV